MANGDAIARVRAALAAHGCRIEQDKDDDFMAQCPAHADGRPSLHVTQRGGNVALHCFAECTSSAVVEALRLSMRDLFDEPRTSRSSTGLPQHHPNGYRQEAAPPRLRTPISRAFSLPDDPPDDALLTFPVSEPMGEKPGKFTRSNRMSRTVAEYLYADSNGEPLHVVVRLGGPKDFRHFDPVRCEWKKNAAVDRIPYRLPEVLDDVANRRVVFVVEGEKDADVMRVHGLRATTAVAGKWTDAHSERLRGVPLVVVIEDRDRDKADGTPKQTGAAKAASACDSLRRVLPPETSVKCLALPPVLNGHRIKDAADFFAAGGTVDLLKVRVKAAPPVSLASDASAVDPAQDDSITPIATGPVFSSSGCYGPLGDWVRLWEPHTEASPVALYAGAIAALGAVVGRDVFVRRGRSQHAPRFYVVLVGPSGRGRKGTAISFVRDLVETLAPEFARTRICTGLSTTEGVIQLLRDETPARIEPGGRERPAIPGVEDKRLLVIEEEMSSPFRVMRREGSDLSATLRTAWDGHVLQRVTKNDPMRATAPHLNILGAITSGELRSTLQTGDVLNGFANRLLPIHTSSNVFKARSSEPLPHALGDCLDALRRAIDFARARRGEYTLSAEAETYWEEHYPRLRQPDERSEALQALQERGAPYVLRLALLFALLDRAHCIAPAHLEAAQTLWQYAAASWREVYADDAHVRSPLAAKIAAGLLAAGPDGLTLTDIRVMAVKSNNVKGVRAALQELASDGIVVKRDVVAQRPGRPAEWWRHAWCQPTSAVPVSGRLGEMGYMGEKTAIPPSLFPESSFSPNSPNSPILPREDDDIDPESGWASRPDASDGDGK